MDTLKPVTISGWYGRKDGRVTYYFWRDGQLCEGQTVAFGPKDLEQLREAIQAGRYSDLEMTRLPTFGGDDPPDTARVWSWDATRLLVGTCADDLRIVERAEVARGD